MVALRNWLLSIVYLRTRAVYASLRQPPTRVARTYTREVRTGVRNLNGNVTTPYLRGKKKSCN